MRGFLNLSFRDVSSRRADPPTETSAAITGIKLYRITETNGTLIEWYALVFTTIPWLSLRSGVTDTFYRATDFSADVSPAVIKFESKAIAETLVDIRKALVHAA